jgi:pimeloyl-ACP methyl ester carboxylesterase
MLIVWREYAEIVSRLLAEGFHVLATDVRGGGNRFGGVHRASPAGPGFRYCTAIADLEAAVRMARANGLTGPLFLWGSYTATLSIQLAAQHPEDVRAVLAFSPARGEPMSECEAIAHAPSVVRAGIPMLIVNSSAELENLESRSQFDRLSTLGARTFVAAGRGHGSSILVPGRFTGDVAPQWSAVIEFLRSRKQS